MQVSDEMIQAAVRAYTDQCGGFYAAGHKPMAAALTAALTLSGWRTIDSAPTAAADDKDPPVVLLWVDGGGERGQGCEAFGRCYRKHDGSVRGVPSGFHGFKVTHWMPRPAPPATAGKEG